MVPQDPKDYLKGITNDKARDLWVLDGELAALKEDAIHWLSDPVYASLRLRPETT
jgi:hypothetical protein